MLRHLSGDGNVASDLVSRALWRQLEVLCQNLNVRPTAVTLETRERDFIVDILKEAATRHRLTLDASALELAFGADLPADV